MPKARTVYQCQSCAAQTPKWMGRCTECGQWNTLVEARIQAAPSGGLGYAGLVATSAAQDLASVEAGQLAHRPSGIPELDRVLGGGIVDGSAVLVGGDPGIGKSTLLLHLLQEQARAGQRVLYVSGEESARQVRLRADRLGGPPPGLRILAETDLGAILGAVEAEQPHLIVADSVQTLQSGEIESAPGTVSQVREVSGRLVVYAKTHGAALFLVGHVTKDGAIAGPRLLEHMVDTVLYFEEGGHSCRLLRAVKNRFGSTNEVAVFEMTDTGLRGVANPSALFLAERPAGAPGSAVFPLLEGTRPLLVEVQALTTPAAFGTAQRTTAGIDKTRVQILAALLERHLQASFADHDVFINVAGGLKVREPAVDLALAASMLSSIRTRGLPPDAVFFGEIGLSGEVRTVSRPLPRLAEARDLGFRRAIVPAALKQALGRQAPLPLEGIGCVADLDRLS